MSTRVLNPVMMTEISRNLGVIVASGVNNISNNSSNSSVMNNNNNNSGDSMRVVPNRAALARVRRDLFGPVDHAAARALAERELKAQSILDSERWGFDFKLEMPTNKSSRFEWKLVTSKDVVPEPYALRGMPYLRQGSLGTRQRKSSLRLPHRKAVETIEPVTFKHTSRPTSPSSAERTPPQEARVPLICADDSASDAEPVRLSCQSPEPEPKEQPTTPVLSTIKKQASITDFMKSRKRAVATTKTIGKSGTPEPVEKAIVGHSPASHIRS